MKFEKTNTNSWIFEDGIEVYFSDSGDWLRYAVYDGERFLGYISSYNNDVMQQVRIDLDEGHNPIAEGWEDGNGNTCTLDGWGEEE